MEGTAFAQLVNRLVEFYPALQGRCIASGMLAEAFTIRSRTETEPR